MAMNHKPTINGTDNGIWRRIRIIPFSQSFKGRADLALGEKLLAELPGILNWALAGLQAWQRDGLGTAKAIDEATNEYRRESDLVSQWLEECTESDIDGRMPAGDAIDSYAAWCKRNGYRAPTSRALGRRLAEIGPELRIAMMRSNGVRHYTGVRLVDVNSAVSAVSAVDLGNFPSNSLSRGLSQTNGTNGTNGTAFEKKAKNLPRSDMLLIVNRRLALAEQGDAGALTVARTYMAANDAYDWTEQLDKAEQLACVEAV
jgi:phage/plasmid-associated DNA primase